MLLNLILYQKKQQQQQQEETKYKQLKEKQKE